MTKVLALVCPSCKEIIYSRARHDFNSCTCGEISVDGGLEYTRILFKEKKPAQIEIEVDATVKQLYNDWNTGKDKFGRIKWKKSF